MDRRPGEDRANRKSIVSDEEIDYPKAMKPDLLLAMNQKSAMNSTQISNRMGSLIVDSTFVTQIPTPKAFQVPFTRIAREKFKREVVANIVALGALTQLTPIVSAKAMEAAVLAQGAQRHGEIEPGCLESRDDCCQAGEEGNG